MAVIFGIIYLEVMILKLVSCMDSKLHFTNIGNIQKKAAIIKGDVMIGALFPIHAQPSIRNIRYSIQCGRVQNQYGMQRIEAALQTVDTINRSHDLLRNITLGIDIRDTCWNSPLALHQTINFIQQSFNHEWLNCSNSESKDEKLCPELLGIVGPASSDETLEVQNLLQLFQLPQIGYSATSTNLNAFSKSGFFMRLVPSDHYQALVMIHILKKFDWTFISVAYTVGDYGQNGINEFKLLANENDICIFVEQAVVNDDTDEGYNNIIKKFGENKKSKVVVCFCEGDSIRKLLNALRILNRTNDFLLIGSDGWAGRDDVVRGLEPEAHGNIMVRLHSQYVQNFDEYYFNLSKREKDRNQNPWFKEFWQSRFNCTFNSSKNQEMPACTGNENLNESYVQDPKLSFVIKSIYVFAHAFDKYRYDQCGGDATCSYLYPINGSLFINYFKKVSFKYQGEMVSFTENGDPTRFMYDILNYQRFGNKTYNYVTVGSWNNQKLIINDIQFPGNVKNFTSRCSKPCSPGFFRFEAFKKIERRYLIFYRGNRSACCWSCEPCTVMQISDGDKCKSCERNQKPNTNKSSCVDMIPQYTTWRDTEAVISLVFSSIGIAMTLFTSVIFYKYRNTPVVKSSTKELCYVMFVGMILSYCCTLLFVGKPTALTCNLRRIIPGISFTILYGSLFIKSNRIARLLTMSKRRFPKLRPRLISTAAQIRMCFVLILAEAAICFVPCVLAPAEVITEYTETKAFLECDTSKTLMIIPFGIHVLLVMLCTYYAFKTRKLPDNFNEAKFIGFACYATTITWIAFYLTYCGTQWKVLTVCVSFSTNSFIILTFLFFPKLYIILLKPEKNVRSNFITTKTIRCYIGTVSNSTLVESGRSTINSCLLNNATIASKYTQTSFDDLSQEVSQNGVKSVSCQTPSEDSFAENTT